MDMRIHEALKKEIDSTDAEEDASSGNFGDIRLSKPHVSVSLLEPS